MRKPPFSFTELDEIVFLFQGGGALGAFQIGVYQALEERGYSPDWMVGISIGAINASIIAGNPKEKRLEKLNQFWEMITHPMEPGWQYKTTHDQNLLSYYNMGSALYTLFCGQANFFKPALVNPWLIGKSLPNHLSFYDTEPLRETLQKVIDFDYLNDGAIRLSLGAVNVETGQFKFFDNKKQKINVEHIIASCALPPGFPAVKIDEAYYWDGGLYSNTPLIGVINDLPHKNRLCFLVDLFESTGLLPQNMDDLLERAKDINYAGHLDIILNYYDLQLLLQNKIAECIEKLPKDLQKNPHIAELAKYGDAHNVHIAKIMYRAQLQDLHSKDYEFSYFSAKRRMNDGYQQTKEMLQHPNWWNDPTDDPGVVTNSGSIVHHSIEDMHIVVGSETEEGSDKEAKKRK